MAKVARLNGAFIINNPAWLDHNLSVSQVSEQSETLKNPRDGRVLSCNLLISLGGI